MACHLFGIVKHQCDLSDDQQECALHLAASKSQQGAYNLSKDIQTFLIIKRKLVID